MGRRNVGGMWMGIVMWPRGRICRFPRDGYNVPPGATAMHNIDLILTLTAGLAAALVLGYVTQRMRLSPIVGYLLAGVAIGPFTPGFQASYPIAQ